MQKRIERTLTFTPDEVVEGLMLLLKAQDHPVPARYADAKIKLSKDGATVEWTEEQG